MALTKELGAADSAEAQAQELKAKGNVEYKAGNHAEAIKHYQAAAALQPEAPVSLKMFTTDMTVSELLSRYTSRICRLQR